LFDTYVTEKILMLLAGINTIYWWLVSGLLFEATMHMYI